MPRVEASLLYGVEAAMRLQREEAIPWKEVSQIYENRNVVLPQYSLKASRATRDASGCLLDFEGRNDAVAEASLLYLAKIMIGLRRKRRCRSQAIILSGSHDRTSIGRGDVVAKASLLYLAEIMIGLRRKRRCRSQAVILSGSHDRTSIGRGDAVA
ncbi:Hypothetical predicted protein [Olea europaea subsp. europaea]|uniref:Uncharacterized protein n=1 Tax=Olea europaea subsp. europaea TaxID=158383 RepID=A0A8S0QU63_OLEEU|nr:Hypothetical predicted protein [Olea europaea subsp. europaea]